MWPILLCSLVLHLADQLTDAFAALLFYAEGKVRKSFEKLLTHGDFFVQLGPCILTASLIFLPGLSICISELKLAFVGKGHVGKAFGYLLFAPLWSVVLHVYR